MYHDYKHWKNAFVIQENQACSLFFSCGFNQPFNRFLENLKFIIDATIRVTYKSFTGYSNNFPSLLDDDEIDKHIT